MRVVIVAEDSRVSVEGQSEKVDLSTLDEDIHVVQWYGTVGEVEYKHNYIKNTKAPNVRITDFTPYQKYVDAWMVEAQKPLPVPAPKAATPTVANAA
jgi:hypothetical protein